MPESFIMALRREVGLPGEDLKAFGAEYKKLTDEDKADLHRSMVECGLNVNPPQPSKG